MGFIYGREVDDFLGLWCLEGEILNERNCDGGCALVIIGCEFEIAATLPLIVNKNSCIVIMCGLSSLKTRIF